MPLVDFKPNRDEALEELNPLMVGIRHTIKTVTHATMGVPKHDAIVNLHRCTVEDCDPDAADVVVYIETNPDTEMESAADEFRDILADLLLGWGFEQIDLIEVWPRFVQGSWCCISIREGRIIDHVDHEG